MLSKSRFLRRLHRVRPLLLTLFSVLGETWKELNSESIYVLDTFPIPVWDNYRIPRAKVYHTEAYRGYQASKKRYFYGVKLHLLVTREGQPVEFFRTPGSYSDTTGLQWFDFDLPPGSTVYGDKAYNAYVLEDILRDVGIQLSPMRKKNSKRPAPAWLCYLQAHYRKMIETTGSLIERLLPKSIHAVTAMGFELKVVLLVLACSLNYL
jgi:DDE family transposase